MITGQLSLVALPFGLLAKRLKVEVEKVYRQHVNTIRAVEGALVEGVDPHSDNFGRYREHGYKIDGGRQIHVAANELQGICTLNIRW